MGIKENAKRQFGRQAEAYAKGNIFVDVVHLSEVVKRSGVEKHHRVLDIATGAGFLALEFAKKADIVMGCDLTRNMLLKAREKEMSLGLKNTGFLLSDVESLPFPDESFDIVFCNAGLHHMQNIPAAIAEMLRVLRPGGWMITASDPYRADFLDEGHELAVFDQNPTVLLGVNDRVPRLSEFIDVLKTHQDRLDIQLFTQGLQPYLHDRHKLLKSYPFPKHRCPGDRLKVEKIFLNILYYFHQM